VEKSKEDNVMEDIKLYEFMLILNTYLNRMDILADRLIDEERKLGIKILEANAFIPQEVFNKIFNPMIEIFDKREQLFREMQEADNNFEKDLSELYSLYKGIVQ